MDLMFERLSMEELLAADEYEAPSDVSSPE